MQTAVDVKQQEVQTAGARRGDASADVVYAPERDANGNFRWRPMTHQQVALQIIKEDKQGKIKTYTTKEAWRNLEKKFGFSLR